MLEMDFRQYDPAIGRFTSIDPVTHFSNSTYNAFDNNPVYWADPSGADATSLINDLWNRSGSGETKWTNNNNGTFSSNNGQTVNCDDCKYALYNATFIGDKLDLKKPSKEMTAKNIIGYGSDPNEIYQFQAELLFDAVNSLATDDLKLKVLKKLGFGKHAKKALKILSFPATDAISSLAGLMTNDEGLANLPFPFGTIIGMIDDDFQVDDRTFDNMITWDNALKSYESLTGISEMNNVVILYSNELLFSASSINSKDTEIISSIPNEKDWKFAHVGTQYGNTIFILKAFNLKK